jgi:hypothetical protein
VETALKTVEPAVRKARHYFEKMMHEPAPCDPETAAVLEPLVNDVARDLEHASDDIETAKAWLAANKDP